MRKLLRPWMKHMGELFGYRVLHYIDDFLIALSRPGKVEGEGECAEESQVLNGLFEIWAW